MTTELWLQQLDGWRLAPKPEGSLVPRAEDTEALPCAWPS
jgi:hypothetical protein